MTKENAVRMFKEHILQPNKVYDYWQAQQMWAAFTDGLCKDGMITDHQFHSWSTPFRYGRTVTVKQ